MSVSQASRRLENVQGVNIEVFRRGSGAPLLLLLSEEAQAELNSPFVADLAAKHSLIIPMPPGFGASDRPDWVSSPDDISYVYLDLLDTLDLGPTPVVGLSLGGWIALEMAVKQPDFVSRLVLVDSFGVKIGGPFERDFQDIWTLHPAKVAALKWSDLEKGRRNFVDMPEAEVAVIARNIESFARFCWDPYMHNPKLRQRLHRIKAPTLVLWGDSDGVAAPSLGKALSGLIAGARFATIGAAGHYPQIEQPAALVREIETFIG
jgi:pimeloyl-ACP methyl ester carboxylesterase